MLAAMLRLLTLFIIVSALNFPCRAEPNAGCGFLADSTDKFICSSKLLSALDQQLTGIIDRNLALQTEAFASALRIEQTAWLTQRTELCQVDIRLRHIRDWPALEYCLADLYSTRGTILEARRLRPPLPTNLCAPIVESMTSPGGKLSDVIERSQSLPPEISVASSGPDVAAMLKTLLTQRFQASEDLLGRIDSFAEAYFTGLSGLPDSGFYALSNEAGSAHCSGYLFFRHKPGEQATYMEEPDAIGRGWTCMGNLAEWSRVRGSVAVILSDWGHSNDFGFMRVVPYEGDHWGRACDIAKYHQTTLSIAESRCDKQSCEPYNQIALNAARHYYIKSDQPFIDDLESLDAVDRERVEDYANFASAVWAEREFPGKPVESGEIHLAATDPFSTVAEPLYLPAKIDGRLYLTRIGKASIGWRNSSYLLFGLYRLGDRETEPIAEIAIKVGAGKRVGLEIVAPE